MRVSHGVSAAYCRLSGDGPDTGDLPDDLETRMVTALRSMKTDLVDAAMEGYCSCCLLRPSGGGGGGGENCDGNLAWSPGGAAGGEEASNDCS